MSEEPSNVVELFKDLRERADRERTLPPLQGGGGDGTSGGMEARVAKVEASIEHIQQDIAEIKGDVRSLRDNAHTDFRILFGAVAIGLAGLLARGFHWL